MKKEKRVILAACLLTVLLFGILTIQAMTEIRVTNPVHTGVVDIDLSEYQINEKGEEELWQDNPTVLPGMTISKIPRINNLGYDCYVRAKMEFDIEGMDQSYQELGSDWFLGKDGYYYCKKILQHGESTDIFQSIKIPEDFPQEMEEKQFHLDIKADAIQSENFTPDFEAEQPWGKVEIQDCKETGPYEVNTVKKTDALSVVYKGDSKKLFADPDNFFINFSDIMPGDIYHDQAVIKNSSNKKIKLYFAQETNSDSDLLKRITLKIKLDDQELFHGTMAEAIDRKQIAELKAGEEQRLSYTVEVPKELDNNYTLEDEEIVWIFSTEEVNGRGKVQTGDGGYLYFLLAGICITGAYLMLRRKKEDL